MSQPQDSPKWANTDIHQQTIQGQFVNEHDNSTSTQNALEVQAFAMHFLSAFEDLDMPTFIACFADEATVFFPAPEPPLRFAGKSEIQRRFEVVFAAIRTSASGGPPFHLLPPQDLVVQIIAPETALVSFHLLNAERTARRTLVLVKSEGGWRIIHLHASNVAP